MRTILYQPVYINPQAYFVFPSLYHIEKGDSYVEPAVYTGQLLIDVVDGSASSVIIKDTKQVDFSDYAGKHIRISQYTDEGAVVLGEWLIPSNQVYLDSHLVDAWFMSGYSNDNPPASISGYKGHELVLKNFAFAGSSGFGKYAQSFLLWLFGNRVNNDSTKHYNKFHIVKNAENVNNYFGLSVGIPKANYNNSIPYKLKITTDSQNPVNFKISSSDGNLNTTDAFSYVVNNGDIIDVPVIPEDIFNNSIETRVYYTVNTNANIYFDIELLPDNAGSLVFDGVDDYAVCDNMPIQTDYTVICRREIINTNNSSAVASKRTYPNDIGFFGAFVIERVTANGSKALYSFGKDNAVDSFDSNQIIYQSKTAYNGKNLVAGDSSDTNILSLGANAYNLNLGRCQEFSNVAIYYFALYDKSLTPDEIEQEKIKLNEIWTKRLNR